jgi:hypothetical protein
MYPYIICFCGKSLGDIYDMFLAMKHDLYKSHIDEFKITSDAGMSILDSRLSISLVPIFDMCRLDNECCRTHIQKQVQFKEIY